MRIVSSHHEVEAFHENGCTLCAVHSVPGLPFIASTVHFATGIGFEDCSLKQHKASTKMKEGRDFPLWVHWQYLLGMNSAPNNFEANQPLSELVCGRKVCSSSSLSLRLLLIISRAREHVMRKSQKSRSIVRAPTAKAKEQKLVTDYFRLGKLYQPTQEASKGCALSLHTVSFPWVYTASRLC